MADKDPSEQMNIEMRLRSHVREILDGAAKEMGFAVDSIRHEVIEKGWFKDSVTPDVANEWLKDRKPEFEHEGSKDFSREDLYGHDPNIENGRDLEPEQDLGQDLER